MVCQKPKLWARSLITLRGNRPYNRSSRIVSLLLARSVPPWNDIMIRVDCLAVNSGGGVRHWP